MKKILLAALSTILLTTVSIAQQQQTMNTKHQAANNEHLTMKDGKMYHSLNGKEMIMGQQMTLHNGTVMHLNGSYQLKNGKTHQLKNGNCMDMSGRKYRSHQMFQNRMTRMHGAKMHPGGNHQKMNMGGHH